MKNEIRMSNFNGKTGYEIIAYPESTDEDIPDTSNVGKEFYELNYKGLFCYGLKVIVKLIKHFKAIPHKPLKIRKKNGII